MSDREGERKKKKKKKSLTVHMLGSNFNKVHDCCSALTEHSHCREKEKKERKVLQLLLARWTLIFYSTHTIRRLVLWWLWKWPALDKEIKVKRKMQRNMFKKVKTCAHFCDIISNSSSSDFGTQRNMVQLIVTNCHTFHYFRYPADHVTRERNHLLHTYTHNLLLLVSIGL